MESLWKMVGKGKAVAFSTVIGFVGVALASSTLLADDVAWVLDGSTNRVAVASARSANGAPLKTRLSNEAVSSGAAILMTTRAPGIALIIR